jgi:hypothetical protein
MKDFFTMHGLEAFFLDVTTDEKNIDGEIAGEIRKKCLDEIGHNTYVSYRSVEILERLSRNTKKKKWVAVDDMNLRGIDGHFVRTQYRYTWEDAEKCIKLLTV